MTYGKEPFDLRLTLLCMLRRLPIILAGILLGTLVFGGGYYVKNVLLRGQCLYAAKSTYRVEYAAEEKDVGTVYINQTSWNTYMQSQMFLEAVQSHLVDTAKDGGGEVPSQEELGGMLEAFLASDLRVPSTTVTTNSPEKSLWIAQAVEAAMTKEFPHNVREVVSVSVIDPGSRAEEVIPDVRVGRAFALSAVLSGFFCVVTMLLWLTGEDGIRLPSTIWKRYGIRTVGTPESQELAENLRYFFQVSALREAKAQRKIAVCPVQEQIDTDQVLKAVCHACPELEGFVVPAPLTHPEVCRELRETEGILLAVQAGSHGGRQMERVLEYLQQQDCNVTAAILWQADEQLLKWYYSGFLRTKSKRPREGKGDK